METQIDENPNQASETLTFENPHFLQSLFANDLGLLKQLEELFLVKVVTRDGWLKIEGARENVTKAKSVFETLESVRRKGGEITAHTFRLAMNQAHTDEVNDQDGSGAFETGNSLEELTDMRLLGSVTKSPVMPRTGGQLKYLSALQKFEVVFGLGPAGTGKTFITLYNALKDVLGDRSPYDKIYIVRSLVATREIGFLPGDHEDKSSLYQIPYKNMVKYMFEMGSDGEFETLYTSLKSQETIKFWSTSFLRGVTLDNAVIIIDEMQNLNFHELDSIITRVGENTRIVFCGDAMQSDLVRDKEKNGIHDFMRILEVMEDDFTMIEMGVDDICRSGLVRNYLIAKHSVQH